MHRCNEHIILSRELSLITLTLSCPHFQKDSYCPLFSHLAGPPFHWRITRSIFLRIFLLKHIEMEGKGWFRSFWVSCWWVFGLLAGLEYCPNGCNYTKKYYRGFVWVISALPQDHNRKAWPLLHLYISICLFSCVPFCCLGIFLTGPFLPYKSSCAKTPIPISLSYFFWDVWRVIFKKHFLKFLGLFSVFEEYQCIIQYKIKILY